MSSPPLRAASEATADTVRARPGNSCDTKKRPRAMPRDTYAIASWRRVVNAGLTLCVVRGQSGSQLHRQRGNCYIVQVSRPAVTIFPDTHRSSSGCDGRPGKLNCTASATDRPAWRAGGRKQSRPYSSQENPRVKAAGSCAIRAEPRIQPRPWTRSAASCSAAVTALEPPNRPAPNSPRTWATSP